MVWLLHKESDPAGLSGFHYLRGACEDAILPGDFGLLNKQTVLRDNKLDKQMRMPYKLKPNLELPHTMMLLMRNLIPHKPIRLSQTVTQNLQPQNWVERGICSFYRKGICIYWKEGKGCPKEHPRPYKQVINYGTKGPHGWTLRRDSAQTVTPKCAHHPLPKPGECSKDDCKPKHVTGTKRTHRTTGLECNCQEIKVDCRNSNKGQKHPATTNSNGFLEAILL